MDDVLERDLRAIYGAYEYLREHDLVTVSTTSRLLRGGDLRFLAGRARAEMEELRGAVAGTHSHGGGRDDVVLEAYQSLYWLIALAVAAGDRYGDVRPHDALAPPVRAGAIELAEPWLVAGADDPAERRRALREGFSIIGTACRAAGVAVAAAVQRDMAELRAKEYLAPYWAAYDGVAASDG